MTQPIMTCERFHAVLADYLEGELDAATRAAVDAHAGECLVCASLLRDLRGIERSAGELPVLEPSRDLWDGIAGRIDAPVIRLAPRERGRQVRVRAVWLGAAAAVLVGVTAGTTYLVTRRAAGPQQVATDRPAPAVSAPASVLVQPAANGKPTAMVTYDQEIARLRSIVDARRADLDPATIATVESSLATIDHAIADAQKALVADSASTFLRDELNKALQKKLGILRTVALLPPRT